MPTPKLTPWPILAELDSEDSALLLPLEEKLALGLPRIAVCAELPVDVLVLLTLLVL